MINCSGLGYEIQTINSIDEEVINEEIVLWLQYLKREDADMLFGFKKREERDFFRILIGIKGIGPQIGMSILNSYSFKEVISALLNENKTLFNNVPGIGKKMTDRIFFELHNKFKDYKLEVNQENTKSIEIPPELEAILVDVDSALNSLDYSKKDILNTNNFLKENIKNEIRDEGYQYENFTFEELFKEALYHLDKNQLN